MVKKFGLSALVAISLRTFIWGEAFPLPQEEVVNDFAQILSEERKVELKEILNRVESQTGVEITLVTVPSFLSYKPKAKSIESFAQSLFNQWGVGHRPPNNGVLILVSVKERRVRYEFGSDFSDIDIENLSAAFKEKILPYFDTRDYSNALFASAMYVVQEVTAPVNFWEYYKAALLLGFFFLVSLTLALFGYSKKQNRLKLGGFFAAGVFLFFLVKNLYDNSLIPGFGGGETSGVGLTEKWTES